MKVNCNPQGIVDQLEAIDNNNDKLKFVITIIDSCGVKDISGTGAMVTTPKTKRPMSGWICYLKTCAKETTMNYMGCVKNADRKKEKYFPYKEEWSKKAKEGCLL